MGEQEIPGNLETILRPGQIVGGRYRVDKLIGQGGMAAVWSGSNERTGKRIALKVILRSFAASGEATELFAREALAASRVNHPNVVSVFDVIDHEGMTCIVMELLEGVTLGHYLVEKGCLDLDETVALLLPAMRGVAAANAQGVVHRDLKPGNIFLCIGADGRFVTTKVLDFGISVIKKRSVDTAKQAEQPAKFGTPAYMSPEHIQCSPQIDARADVYGFGILFFEALTGKPPFVGEPGPDLLMRVLQEPAPRVTDVRKDLPPALAVILECALAKEPNDRFPNLDQFIHAVEEQLLPAAPLPRGLTPMIGVPVVPLPDVNSGLVGPVVQMVNRDSSGLHDASETRVMYSLPRDLGREPGRESGQSSRSIEKKRSRAAATRNRTLLGAILAVSLIFLIWVAIPRQTEVEDLPPKSIPTSAPAPMNVAIPALLPKKIVEHVALPPPLPVPALPVAPLPVSPIEKGDAVVGLRERTGVSEPPAQKPTQAQPGKRRVARSGRSSSPRAGGLTLHDF
jgi:serine/threonine-protein kinase